MKGDVLSLATAGSDGRVLLAKLCSVVNDVIMLLYFND
jgi:hypothetical protein